MSLQLHYKSNPNYLNKKNEKQKPNPQAQTMEEADLLKLATEAPNHALLILLWFEIRSLKQALMEHMIRVEERSKNG